MPLDRQSIERRDFPIGRRGYEPEAVDSFLAELADQVETLQRAERRQSPASMAQAASEQVRAIVEAAETSAADIERAAEEEASQIRSEAARDADRTRNDAVERAREHVGSVSEATATMLQRVSAMQSELDALVEQLRTGANRVSADLALLEGNMADLYNASGAGSTQASAAPAAAAPSPVEAIETPAPELEAVEPAAPEADAVVEPELDAETVEEPAAPSLRAVESSMPAAPEPEATNGGAVAEEDADVEGARLIALNMALNGQSREETDKYLAENFDLPDRQRLLDEVYASVEG